MTPSLSSRLQLSASCYSHRYTCMSACLTFTCTREQSLASKDILPFMPSLAFCYHHDQLQYETIADAYLECRHQHVEYRASAHTLQCMCELHYQLVRAFNRSALRRVSANGFMQ